MSSTERITARAYRLHCFKKREAKNKFKAIKTTVEGITFHSKGEAKRYQELKLLEKAGEIDGLTLQVKIPLIVNEQLICNYICDFWYTDQDAKLVIEDFKGHRTPEYLLKKKLFEALYAPLTITETGKRRKRT